MNNSLIGSIGLICSISSSQQNQKDLSPQLNSPVIREFNGAGEPTTLIGG